MEGLGGKLPVTPSFGAYAKTPDVAGAYIGAQRNAISRENIAADAAAAAARIQLGREQLAAAAVQNAMELEAKKEIYSKQAMQRSQEAEIEKAYRETQFGLKERELQNDEAITAMRIQEAASGFDQQLNYERYRAELVAGGMDEREASETSMRKYGFGKGGFGTAFGGRGTGGMAERNFQYKALKDEEDRIRKGKPEFNPQYTPDELKRLDEIQRKRQTLLEPPSAGAVPLAPQQQQQWQIDPRAIPNGAPVTESFIGTPPPPQFGQIFPDVPMMPQTNTPSLRILNVRKK